MQIARYPLKWDAAVVPYAPKGWTLGWAASQGLVGVDADGGTVCPWHDVAAVASRVAAWRKLDRCWGVARGLDDAPTHRDFAPMDRIALADEDLEQARTLLLGLEVEIDRDTSGRGSLAVRTPDGTVRQATVDDIVAAFIRPEADPLAAHAAAGLTRDEVRSRYDLAREFVQTQHYAVVVRAAVPDGYIVWTGLRGGMAQVPGRFCDYSTALDSGIGTVRGARLVVATRINQILEGWSPDTPFAGATLGTWVEDSLIAVRRGPVMGPCKSYELPVYEVVTGRHIARVGTYDEAADEASRSAWQERSVQALVDQVAREQTALSMIAEIPECTHLVEEHAGGLRLVKIRRAATAVGGGRYHFARSVRLLYGSPQICARFQPPGGGEAHTVWLDAAVAGKKLWPASDEQARKRETRGAGS